MNRLCTAIAGLLILFGCATSGEDAGWITLIDGTARSLDNFNRVGDANWRVEDGAIVADKGKGGLLVSKNSYKDFQIRAEFWADHTTNSGIYIRATDPNKIGSTTAYEVNIFDQRPDPSYGTGAIVNYAKVAPMPKAGGQWNILVITAEGPRLYVDLNGQRTANITETSFPSGPFALQFANRANDAPGGAIKWRKVQIKPL
jgi:3-keto-disaccharide hydrolase